jgi:HD-GYP domain-containing protein (c-di-GMP phosphodiesterase class II)
MEIDIAMELPRSVVENVRVAGLLHDIGQIEVSGEILSKAAKLTTESPEGTSDKRTYLITSVGAVLKEVAPVVLAHHKYFMSTLETDEREKTRIPLGARVIAVADAFDTMTTDRPHRKALPPLEALGEITSKAGKQFDPEVVRAFKLVFANKMEQAQPRE